MENRCGQAASLFLDALSKNREKGKNESLLKAFSPFPTASDRQAYQGLPEEIRHKIIKEGESFLSFAYPPIRATDYMSFKRTGSRAVYEDPYFSRRKALNSLVLAECAEGEGRFLDDIINGIYALCEESAWQIPPHNSYIRDSEQLILPDFERPVLDLFSCETGAQLSCILYLLSEQLDQISPFITKRIHRELENRILQPYLTEHFWWMGRDGEEMCNWTVWCTQNVLITAFLADFPEQTRLEVLKKAAFSCDYFLAGYGEDGCCDEGAHYYRHAGLCLFCALDILDQVTGGFFAPLFQWEKIKNIASYILNVHVKDNCYFNFSDCSATPGYAGAREYLFGKRTGQRALMLFGARDFGRSGFALYNDEGISLYYRLQTAFCSQEMIDFAWENPADILPEDIFYPSVGLFVARSPLLSLAVKAGDNADSHNHNDTGSFTLYKDGKPLFIDIGVESYTKKTFSERRYEIWTMQSCYHNLPTLDGLDQRDGAAFRATQVKTAFDQDKASISMELSEAYPFSENACLAGDGASPSYVRKVILWKKENKIKLTDCTNCENVTLNLITYYAPSVKMNSGDCGEIVLEEIACASFRGAELFAIDTLPVTDPRLKASWDHDLYRIRLTLTGGQFDLCIQ